MIELMKIGKRGVAGAPQAQTRHVGNVAQFRYTFSRVCVWCWFGCVCVFVRMLHMSCIECECVGCTLCVGVCCESSCGGVCFSTYSSPHPPLPHPPSSPPPPHPPSHLWHCSTIRVLVTIAAAAHRLPCQLLWVLLPCVVPGFWPCVTRLCGVFCVCVYVCVCMCVWKKMRMNVHVVVVYMV